MPEQMIQQKHTSVSQLSTLWRCGLKYKFEYKDKKRGKYTTKTFAGSVVHKVQEAYTKARIAGSDIPEESLTEVTEKYFNILIQKGLFLNKDERSLGMRAIREVLLEQSIKLSAFWYHIVFPEQDAIESEKKFNLSLPGYAYTVLGIIDIIGRNHVIRDLKVIGQEQSKIWDEIQYATYSLAYYAENKVMPVCWQDSIVKRKESKKNPDGKPDYRPVSAQFKKEVINVLCWHLEQFEKITNAGLYGPCNKNTFWCGSETVCEHYRYCPAMIKKQYSLGELS